MNIKDFPNLSRQFLRTLDSELLRIESDPNYEKDFQEWKERRKAEDPQRTENK